MALVSSAQLTITDQNDAKSLTCYIIPSPGNQQIFTKDESTVSYLPSWYAANTNTGLLLTAKVFAGGVGGADDVTGLLSNRKWCLTQGGTALVNGTASTDFCNDALVNQGTPFTVVHDGTTSTIKIRGNLKDTIGVWTLFFEGDYTDPATALTVHVLEQISLQTVKTGTNAVYLQVRGNPIIETSTTATRNVTAIAVDLTRSGGVVDTSGVTYQFYQDGGATQVTTTLNANYGQKTTASGTAPTGAVGEVGVNNGAAASWGAYNTLVIHENAVASQEVYKAVAKDADGISYVTYFTVTDVSDPFTCKIDGVDKMVNGTGSTVLTPKVWYGGLQRTDLSRFTFTWYVYDRNYYRCAFVDTAKIATAGGALISANTSGANGTFTYGGTSYAFVAGDVIKVVRPNGLASFYEVASSTTNFVTIRAAATQSAWLNSTNFPYPATSEFVNGYLFGCTTGGTRTGSSITVTSDDIDVKGTISVDVDKSAA